jgi:hypothetical protein
VLIVGFLGGGGGGGITQLIGDVLAGPGSGMVASTVVSAQDGAILFEANGTIKTVPGSGLEATGPWQLGVGIESSVPFDGVRMYVGETAVTSPSSSNHVLWFNIQPSGLSYRTTMNAADATGFGLLDLTVGEEQNIELEGAFGGTFGGFSIGIAGHHGSFFGGTGSGIPFLSPNVIALFNAGNTNLTIPANLLTQQGQFYAGLLINPATDVGPKGMVYVGALEPSSTNGGAISSMAPNGFGTINTQLGIGILERFYAQTTAGAPTHTTSYLLPINSIGDCVFIGKVWVCAQLHTVGGGGGTIGDRYSIGYNVQGSIRTSSIFPFPVTTTVTLTTDMAIDADTSMLSNTFVIGGISGPSGTLPGLTFDATGVLAGGPGTINWQWDLDLKVT